MDLRAFGVALRRLEALKVRSDHLFLTACTATPYLISSASVTRQIARPRVVPQPHATLCMPRAPLPENT